MNIHNEIFRAMFPKEVERIDRKQCPFCAQDIKLSDFDSELSLREYRISGICQECQNKVFSND